MNNIYKAYGVDDALFARSERALTEVKDVFAAIEEIRAVNQLRVIDAFQQAGILESQLGGSSGYGYDDQGRVAVEKAFACYFGTEAALVRHQFSSGTQVLLSCLRGLLRPGDELLIASGEPYDTIKPALAPLKEGAPRRGALAEFGIRSRVIPLDGAGRLDEERILSSLCPETRLVYLQRSRGYTRRAAFTVRELGALAAKIKALRPELWIMVDNCYGEFCETEEPTRFEIDLCAGSLIKNAGAGIAPCGGYIVGKEALIELIANGITAPGVGSHIGPSLGFNRLIAQGFYFAPRVTAEALKSAVHAAALCQASSIPVSPGPFDRRADIVQCVSCGTEERLIHFCQAIQAASPVDAAYAPVPAPMPGYDCDIIMASGSFVQGSSIELSCDGPLRPPYDAFLQGGLSFENSRLAVMRALRRLEEKTKI